MGGWPKERPLVRKMGGQEMEQDRDEGGKSHTSKGAGVWDV